MFVMNFSEKLGNRVISKKSCFMLGLDPNLEKMPDFFSKTTKGIYDFCIQILESTHDLICGIKLQMAYFEVFGAEGIKIVEKLLELARQKNLNT